MEKTPMQDLKEDLIKSIESGKEVLLEIKDEHVRECCQNTLEITLKNVIKRIDEELLLKEKEVIENAYDFGRSDEDTRFPSNTDGEDYFKSQFTQSI